MSAQATGLVPHLVVNGASKAIDFYKAAFGAQEVSRVPAQDGKRLMHGEVRIGESTLYLCDDFPEFCGGKSRHPGALGGTPVVIHQSVPNCDTAIKRAADAGAAVTMPAQDMFWGDRYGQVTDPFGHTWSFSTPLKK
jgi:PhnB protein